MAQTAPCERMRGELKPAEFAGRVLGGTYKVLRQLDEGGMARLFEAEHLRLHRRVAVKVLSADCTRTPEMYERLAQEAEIISLLEHPHIVTILDFDVTEEGEPYLVLELLHGETLADRLDREAHLPLEAAMQIIAQVASGLGAAHRASIVHRDLKPANIFLTRDAEEPTFVKLLDFGVGRFLRSQRRITGAFRLVGTPDYMAPEQALGRSDLVDVQTDEYGLAVVVYEMLTGEQPFAHPDVSTVLDRVLHLEPPPPSSVAPWVPDSVDAVLRRALAKDRAARFASVAEFSTALAGAIGACGTASTGSRFVVKHGTPPTRLGPFTTPPHPTDPEDTRTWPSPGAEPVLASLARTREALGSDSIPAAIHEAATAFDLAERSADPSATAALRQWEPLLEHVFLRGLGSLGRRLIPRDISACPAPRSPRLAFLLSRLEPGMSIEEVIDVSAMPRLEALRRLAELVALGAVQVE